MNSIPTIQIYRANENEGAEVPSIDQAIDDETLAFQLLQEAERKALMSNATPPNELKLSPHSHIRRLALSSSEAEDLDLVIDVLHDTEDSFYLTHEFIIRNVEQMPLELVQKLFSSMNPDDFVTRYEQISNDPFLSQETINCIPIPANQWIGPNLVLSVFARSYFSKLTASERSELQSAFAEIINMVNEADLSHDSSIALKSLLSSEFFRALRRTYVRNTELKILPTG